MVNRNNPDFVHGSRFLSSITSFTTIDQRFLQHIAFKNYLTGVKEKHSMQPELINEQRFHSKVKLLKKEGKLSIYIMIKRKMSTDGLLSTRGNHERETLVCKRLGKRFQDQYSSSFISSLIEKKTFRLNQRHQFYNNCIQFSQSKQNSQLLFIQRIVFT